MDNRTCKKCGHLCHCIEADHEGCKCTGCNCKVSIHELVKANPNKSYRALEIKMNSIVIDDTNECEWCG